MIALCLSPPFWSMSPLGVAATCAAMPADPLPTPAILGVLNMSELSKAWNDIYAALDENAFDYVGKPFYNDNDNSIMLWNGSKMVTYVEVPF